LPGLGSFLAAAADSSDTRVLFIGLLSLISVIIALDIAVWRPLIRWSRRFQFSSSSVSSNIHINNNAQSPSTIPEFSADYFTRSPLFQLLTTSFIQPAWKSFCNLDTHVINFTSKFFPNTQKQQQQQQPSTTPMKSFASNSIIQFIRRHALSALKLIAFITSGLWITLQSIQVIRILSVVPFTQWMNISVGAMLTLGRVCLAVLLSILFAVPLGVSIGRDPKLAARIQPIVQIAASVPATALFPFLLLLLIQSGGSDPLRIGSVLLMTLGTCWLVLFNVIAGTQAIPSEMFDVASVYAGGNGFIARRVRWCSIILPAIFPYLLTGVITAVGGAWNASIVSEFVAFQGGILQTTGLGAIISNASLTGDYPVLLAATLMMCFLVLFTNRVVWNPLTNLANTRFKMIS